MRLSHKRYLFGSLVIVSLLYLFMVQHKFPSFEERTNTYPLPPKDYLENIPKSYLENVKKPTGVNNTCAKYPNLKALEFNNLYWQTLRTKNTTFQLLGAYLDTRTNDSIVRLIGSIDELNVTTATFCQFWFAGAKAPSFAPTRYKYIWNRYWGNFRKYQAYLISCTIPKDHSKKTIESVSLVEEPCHHATNNIRVIHNVPKEKKDFAVCVKGLDFPDVDLSLRLIEWIELLGLLGADKIFFYELQVHPNMKEVLRYYQDIGKIDLTPITLPGGEANVPFLRHKLLKEYPGVKRQNEVIPYNDCFYKHMYEYKYIALLDIDEVIMPLTFMNWKDLMKEVEEEAKEDDKNYSSFDARNIYFWDNLKHEHDWSDDVPQYMYMLQHVYRTINFTHEGYYVKCFHNTEKILTLHNHFPFSCLGGYCHSFSINTTLAQLHHYRPDCVEDLKNVCQEMKDNTIMDSNIWRFKEALIKRTEIVLKDLAFNAE